MKIFKKIILAIILLLVFCVILSLLFLNYFIPLRGDNQEAVNHIQSNIPENIVNNIHSFTSCNYKGGVIIAFENEENKGVVYLQDNIIYKADICSFDNSYVDQLFSDLEIKYLSCYSIYEYCLPESFRF